MSSRRGRRGPGWLVPASRNTDLGPDEYVQSTLPKGAIRLAIF